MSKVTSVRRISTSVGLIGLAAIGAAAGISPAYADTVSPATPSAGSDVSSQSDSTFGSIPVDGVDSLAASGVGGLAPSSPWVAQSSEAALADQPLSASGIADVTRLLPQKLQVAQLDEHSLPLGGGEGGLGLPAVGNDTNVGGLVGGVL